MPSKERRSRPVFSAVLGSDALVETIFLANESRTAFLVGTRDKVREEKEASASNEDVLVPYSATNNLLVHRAVLLPSGLGVFEGAERLLQEIEGFIERYVDLTPERTLVTALFVLLTWVFDRFNEVPYLRVIGDYGTGKSRFLTVVGSLVYKGIFASGASTVSPLFRLLDSVGGTLVVDEGDFRFSDEKAELIKILNNGNAKGFPVLRTEITPRKEFNPTAFSVFGPKIIATRRTFEDKALESRCITFEMPGGQMRESIPISLPPIFDREALSLRNSLLTFRFQCWSAFSPRQSAELAGLEPRTRQIIEPLFAVSPTERARDAIRGLGVELDNRLRGERRDRAEAVLAALLLAWDGDSPPSVGDLARAYSRSVEDATGVSPRWIGFLLRERLGLRTEKRHGVFVVAPGQEERLELLMKRFGDPNRGMSGTSGRGNAGHGAPVPASSA